MSHQERLSIARAAIETLISDTSVSPETTRDSLEELASQIEIALDALADDLPED